MNIQKELDPPTVALLQRYGFDSGVFSSLRQRLTGTPGGQSNELTGHVEPPKPGDITPLPPLGSDARELLAARGKECVARGEVGAVILAGGMATRFGNVVKAAVPAVGNDSFLQLKIRDIQLTAARCKGRVPVFLMTSFATDEDVKHLAKSLSTPECPIRTFPQFISLRLTPAGELFRSETGEVSAYAPGHGDLTFALRAHGILDDFLRGGGRRLLMSNVDNLTATLDPAVIGSHIESGAEVSVEVTLKEPGDQGGGPARVDGRPQIVEAFRFPKNFDQNSIPVFNTNTFTFDANAINRDFPLTWFAVKKKVNGLDAIQFERLVGELTAFLDTRFLRVERFGPDARFQPVKDPDELEARQSEIKQALHARGVL